ncbi:MAG: hypothetical protein ACPIOQ_54320, partial [Promethearchaeia archaeon]
MQALVESALARQPALLGHQGTAYGADGPGSWPRNTTGRTMAPEWRFSFTSSALPGCCAEQEQLRPLA